MLRANHVEKLLIIGKQQMNLIKAGVNEYEFV